MTDPATVPVNLSKHDLETLVALVEPSAADDPWPGQEEITERLSSQEPGTVMLTEDEIETLTALVEPDPGADPWDGQEALTERLKEATSRFGGPDL